MGVLCLPIIGATTNADFENSLNIICIRDWLKVPGNIRKYEGVCTQEGRLKVFIEKVGKWRAAFFDANLLVINEFYWNMYFYLI